MIISGAVGRIRGTLVCQVIDPRWSSSRVFYSYRQIATVLRDIITTGILLSREYVKLWTQVNIGQRDFVTIPNPYELVFAWRVVFSRE